MTTTTTTKKIEIAMSEQAPVRVDTAQWPLVAKAERHDGAVKVQANNEWFIRVREHADGRRIVYGGHEAGNGGQYAGFRETRAGFLVPSGSGMRQPPTDPDGPLRAAPDEQATIRAIRRVAGAIGDERLGDECIADLPAQEL